MRDTWRFWINPDGKPMTGFYYNFKSFKVYWAYRHEIAKKLDEDGLKETSLYCLHDLADKIIKDPVITIIKFNYQARYK